MTQPSDPARERSRLFVGGFVALTLLIAAGALYVNLANPFGLHIKPNSDMDEAAAVNLEPLSIDTSSGPRAFRVEIADDPAEMSKGLMFRQTMPADQGMLFIHEKDGERLMWMKNTYLALDMLFITADGRISHIAERTQPFSETTIASNGPVRAVLELNGGAAAAAGIKVGDVVRHKAFSNAP
jgi:uncharacterized protein